MRTITLEEHFVSPGYLAGPGQDILQGRQAAAGRMTEVLERLRDLGENRLKEMDEVGIDMQVLSY